MGADGNGQGKGDMEQKRRVIWNEGARYWEMAKEMKGKYVEDQMKNGEVI